jgi:membrane protease YdiL (CAAX protease family)
MIDDLDPAIAKRQYNTLILTGIAIAILFYPIVGTFVLRALTPVGKLIISRVLIWLTLPVLRQYAHKVEGRDFFLWKEREYGPFFYPVGIIALGALIFICILIAAIPHALGFHDNYTMVKYWDAILKKSPWLLAFVSITAGVTEELMVRAYILPRLSLIFKSNYMPVIASALLFATLHIGYWNLSEIIFTFLFGIVCAVCYQQFRNIKVLIIFHALYDFLILFRP